MNDVVFNQEITKNTTVTPGTIAGNARTGVWCMVVLTTPKTLKFWSEAGYTLVSLNSGGVFTREMNVAEMLDYIIRNDMTMYGACTITVTPKVPK